MSVALDPLRMRRLLDAGRALVAELDPQAVLERTLAAAREVTGARYAALGVLTERRTELEQFLTLGIDDLTRSAIGDPPHGRGVLGVLVEELRPLRLDDIAEDERSCGFPAGHPQMRSFLGVPVLVGGVAWGSLYLTDKQGGRFTEADEEAAVILADWAATAIENAHTFRNKERPRLDPDDGRAARTVPPAAVAMGGDTGLERVLDLIVKRGRALMDAGDSGDRDALTDGDEQLLRAFAARAAVAVALAQSVESERLRSLMAAADAERSRWARELHDETLQGLGALRLLLAAARRRGDARETELAVDEAIEHIQQEIENLHAIITDLRPAALDELGLRPALEALIERRTDHGTLMIDSRLVLPDPKAGGDRLGPEIESAVYRLVQEALTNVVKHAHAHNVHVDVTAAAGTVSIEVWDDGVGFSPDLPGPGFGLGGMRERASLAGGTITIDSGESGTTVRAELPAHASRGSGGDPGSDSPVTGPT